ncbi:hypothetical protein O181_054424 [Austropuccinia psidii MF-1]|uniref:Uncharacterized protein n=1 Tax=Austropuccinia psidii MF-1 TaxID=1389203 RepID=A0A9Q3E4J6_9BASI|nr:hypothetical protein [Austropuccinia psidii MF-1]
MEDAKTSTSSQRLASTFDTLIESPESDITVIAVRPESFSTGNIRDIPVSVQELVYGSKTERVGTSPKSLDRHHELLSSSEEIHGARKDRGTSEGLDTHVLQRTSPTYKSLVEKPKHVIRGPEEAGPRQGKQPSGSSPSLHKQKSAAKISQQAQENPKDQPEGKSKGKAQGNAQMGQALPEESQDSQEREDSHGKCIQYGKNSYGIQKQGRGKIEPIFSKEVDLLYLKAEIIKNKSSKLGKLNWAQRSSFPRTIGKSYKARLKLKENIQSIIDNVSLKNELPKQSTPIRDRNLLNLNDDLHHTISSNAEVETACNFKNIARLEEWPTFSGEGKYNHMEFMKKIDIFTEDFNIPDE